MTRSRTWAAFRAIGVVALSGSVLSSCGPREYFPQTYLPAEHNWAFRVRYPEADRLFNAFDYGHAIASELLYTRPNDASRALEGREYIRITTRILVDPPPVPLDAEALAPEFTRAAPEIDAMFEWAHALHRQLYDVWADERIPDSEKDGRVERLLHYYRSRRDLAFSSTPKSMDLMDGQRYSRTFRTSCPKFNGLIWSYHWFQVSIYDALLTAKTPEGRRGQVAATVEHFRSMLGDGNGRMPSVMPMTAAVAPVFAARYPEAAIIFDNLHAMHDVVSDILASPNVPRAEKRRELLTAAARYRDSTSFTTSRAEWLAMSRQMGVERMGGPAIP